MTDFKKIDGSILTDNELVRESLKFGYNIHKMNRIPIFDILKDAFDIDSDRSDLIVPTIVHHKIAKYADNNELDLIMKIDGIKAIQTDNPIGYMEKFEADKNKPIIDQSINIGRDANGSQFGHGSVFGDLESSHSSIKREPAIAIEQPMETFNTKSKSAIWDKFVKCSDNKFCSMVMYGLLTTFTTALIGWLGWTFIIQK